MEENNNKHMSSPLKTKILIGALAVTTATAIIVPTVMATRKPVEPEPPQPEPIDPTNYFSVALYAGEGSFVDDQQLLLINNVMSGTPLNQVEGYILPTMDIYHVFYNWYNEKEEIVAPDTPITQNVILIASYVESTEYYREKYIAQIDKEIQNVVDYAVTGQFQFDDYNIYDAMEDMKTASEILKSPSITSINILTKIYQLLHECIHTINQVPVFYSGWFDDLSPYYYQLTQICHNEIANLQEAQNDSQTEAFYLLAKNHLSTYRSENPDLVSEIHKKYFDNIKSATNDIDLAVATKIGGGLIRGGCFLQNMEEHDNVATIIMNKLNSAKETITDPEKLITFIDFLGDCASTYCKIIQEEGEGEINAFEKMYTNAINSFVGTSELDPYRYQMISSFMKGNSYNMKANDIGVIVDESVLLDDIEELELPIEKIKDIKEIVVNAAEVLKNSNEYTLDVWRFVPNILSRCIDIYLETPDFLEFILYAMQIDKNPLPPDDVFFKEGGTYRLNWRKIFLSRLINPLNFAYSYYKNLLNKATETDSIDALKIVVKGIIQSTVYSSEYVDYQYAALDRCMQIMNAANIIDLFTTGSKSAQLSFAYVVASLPTLYTYSECAITNSNFLEEILTNIEAKLIDIEEIEKYFGFLKEEKDEYRAIELGKLTGLNLGLNFIRFIEPYCGSGDVSPDTPNAAWGDILNWNNQFKKMSSFAHTNESFEALKNAIGSTALSSRIRHFAPLESWLLYKEQYPKIMNKSIDLINILFKSSSPDQIIKRADIYVNHFLNVLNQWCAGKDELNLNKLFETVKEEMEAIQ